MNKSELVQRVAEKAEMSRAAAAKAVDAIFDATAGAIGDIVDTAGKLSLPGFGKFESKKRPARKGRNPRTGSEIDIPERNVVTFTPGKAFKERVAGGGTKSGRAGAGAKAGAKVGGATKTAARSGGANGGAAKAGAGGSKPGGAAKSGGGAAKAGGGAKGGGASAGKTGGSRAKK